jgi:hypothetical protein
VIGQGKIFSECFAASDIYIIKFNVLIRARHDTKDCQKSQQSAHEKTLMNYFECHK